MGNDDPLNNDPLNNGPSQRYHLSLPPNYRFPHSLSESSSPPLLPQSSSMRPPSSSLPPLNHNYNANYGQQLELNSSLRPDDLDVELSKLEVSQREHQLDLQTKLNVQSHTQTQTQTKHRHNHSLQLDELYPNNDGSHVDVIGGDQNTKLNAHRSLPIDELHSTQVRRLQLDHGDHDRDRDQSNKS